jgi:type II secretory pathway component PulC
MRALSLLLVSLVLVGCGASRPAAKAASPAPAAAAGDAGAPGPRVSITRSGLHEAIAMGLGVLLQRVELDDQPVLVAGRFHGFRLTALRDPDFWSGVDLQPGDVITGVNGMPIERPEQAQAAFESLESAKELRVAYDRDGKPRELVYAIVDDR